ncbi:hypothetical protein CYY_001825 [Polysphondylium violaceum]|uniref:Cornichon family protein n=1 Tax=Polysphondylium violaceum TaxID=133409 RepID=A0A8J4V3I9_9MYCE|nr:hypothetical protein CYY_001825 [Polysphondylium violaceum]
MDLLILFWIFSLVFSTALVFCSVFTIVAFTDLESDLVSPIDLTRRLNPMIKLEIGIHTAFFFYLFLNVDYILLFINAILFAFHVYSILNNQHRLSATEVYRVLPSFKKRYIVKTAFYIISFFLYLYWFVSYLINEYSGHHRTTTKKMDWM